MKKLFYYFVLTSLVLVSCKKETTADNVAESTVTTDTVAAENAAVAPVAANAMGTNPNTIMNQSTASNIQQTTNVTMPQPGNVAAGANPPHGQPNHRCDIAVGAPLNAAPGKAALSQQSVPSSATKASQISTDGKSVSTTNPSAVTPAVVTAAGMNPPHGQEGHHCEIAVGAPVPKS